MTLKEQLLKEFEEQMKPYFLWNEIWEKKAIELMASAIDRVAHAMVVEKKDTENIRANTLEWFIKGHNSCVDEQLIKRKEIG